MQKKNFRKKCFFFFKKIEFMLEFESCFLCNKTAITMSTVLQKIFSEPTLES